MHELIGDYYIPCLTLPTEEEKPIGIYGQRHLRYLKEYHRATYTNLLTSGKVNGYLAEIDEQLSRFKTQILRGKVFIPLPLLMRCNPIFMRKLVPY